MPKIYNFVEKGIITGLTWFVLHLLVLQTKMYLWKHKSAYDNFLLLNYMKGVKPILPLNDVYQYGVPLNEYGYVVLGTTITIFPREPSDPSGKPKYDIFVFGYHAGRFDMYESQVSLEHIIDNYPKRLSQKFLFNLELFV